MNGIRFSTATATETATETIATPNVQFGNVANRYWGVKTGSVSLVKDVEPLVKDETAHYKNLDDFMEKTKEEMSWYMRAQLFDSLMKEKRELSLGDVSVELEDLGATIQMKDVHVIQEGEE